jgi:uncharacterized protein
VRKNLKIKHKFCIIFLSLLVLLIWFCYWQNNSIEISYIQYKNADIPGAFNGYRILQISDLHNKSFGKNQSKLIAKINKCKPDIIVITGDLVDCHRLNISLAMDFVKQAVTIAPVYYVAGNHERWSQVYTIIKEQLIELGVTVLDNESVIVKRGDGQISITGLMDPNFLLSNNQSTNVINDTLRLLKDKETSDFNILLSHRPELIDIYENEKYDLVFSGHAHGGQFRLPILGGFYAPNQGFNPKYTSGLYNKNDTTMIVSRGLGNSVIPIRLFNRPELIVVTLAN